VSSGGGSWGWFSPCLSRKRWCSFSPWSKMMLSSQPATGRAIRRNGLAMMKPPLTFFDGEGQCVDQRIGRDMSVIFGQMFGVHQHLDGRFVAFTVDQNFGAKSAIQGG
jgi:hypothetical protein